MANVTQNQTLNTRPGNASRTAVKTVAAATKLYQGQLVGPDAGGDLIALIAGAVFGGLTWESGVDNLAGDDGDKALEVFTDVTIYGLTVTGASTVAHVGSAVYAAGDDPLADLTLTQGANTLVGTIVEFNPDDSTFGVHFTAKAEASARMVTKTVSMRFDTPGTTGAYVGFTPGVVGRVTGIQTNHTSGGSGAGTFQPAIDPAGTPRSMTAAAVSVQAAAGLKHDAPALSATPANLQFSASEAIGITTSGTLANCTSIELIVTYETAA